MIIGIGIRKNLLYPFLLLFFISIRIIVQKYLKNYIKENSFFVFPGLIFISKFIFGLMAYIHNTHTSKSKNRMKYQLIIANNVIKQVDSNCRIYLLIFFASFFDFAGSVARQFFTTKILENRARSFQIIVSGLLCYFTIRTKIYKHQIISLIIIFSCLCIIACSEIIRINNNDEEIDIIFCIQFFSCFCRAFLDTIEKYLFEFNYLNPYKVMMLEGFINSFIIFVFFLINEYVINITNSFNIILDKKGSSDIVIFSILIILFFILTGFKNIYRVITIKIYSPMTRALTECILDPILYSISTYGKENIWYYIINIICLIIMGFCSLVYNDFLVLYFCGLENNTHLEITKRSQLLSTVSSDSFYNEGNIFYDDNDDDNDNLTELGNNVN